MAFRPAVAPLLLCLLITPMIPSGAQAQAPLLTGFGGAVDVGLNVLPVNDDESSALIDLSAELPAGLNFFGTTYAGLYVNNNGNVSFGGPIAAYEPMPFPVASQAMVAGFWGDVDTRDTAVPAGENRVYWHVETGRFVATWYRVGYFDSNRDLANSFQVILTDASAVGAAGDFDVELRYNQLEWSESDPVGGLDAGPGGGGTPAQAGFDAGDSVNFFALPGSFTPEILLLTTMSNVGMNGVFRFQVRSGAVVACGDERPEGTEECDDGNLTPGDGCNEFCEIEYSPGGPCMLDRQCDSLICDTGICCDIVCSGDCEWCAFDGFSCEPVDSGLPCRDPLDEICDVVELCDGASITCPPDIVTPNGTSCDDMFLCNGFDTCFDGACVVETVTDCDDFDPCTADSCAEPTGCANDPIVGCSPDAGLDDAGITPPDGGGFDAGTIVDAGAGDAGTGFDGGDPPFNGTLAGSGLGCGVAHGSGDAPFGVDWMLAGLFGLSAYRRRARRAGSLRDRRRSPREKADTSRRTPER